MHCCNIILIPFYNIEIEKKIIQRHMLTLSKGKFESVNNSGDKKEKKTDNKMHITVCITAKHGNTDVA